MSCCLDFARRSVLRRVVFFALVFSLTGCTGFEIDQSYEKCAIASVSPLATQVGLDVFRQGGNAIDAGVAVAFTLAVVYPQAGNIGGGGFALIRNARSGKIESLDFRETAPAAATAEMYLDSSGNVVKDASITGALAAGVPGSVAGLHELWQRYGSLPWEQLLRYAIRYADSGFVVGSHLASAVEKRTSDFQKFPESAKLFLPGNKPLAAGDTLIQQDLGVSLRMIADEGPDAFYRGLIADKIDSCMKKYGGRITKDDLAAYRPLWREPAHFTFDSLDIYTMAPPSSAGVVVGQILKLLQPFSFSRYTAKSPEYIHLFAEAARLAYADRAQHLGDPAFYKQPDGLLSDVYLSRRRTLINPGHATPSSAVSSGNPLPGVEESPQTTHFSVCDSAGNMLAITFTLNTSFGSALIVDEAGFLLNNEMDDFSLKPGVPNAYGLVGSEANKIEPGKRMLSSMSPTLVLKGGQPFMALGSPGGSRITTTVAEAIINISRFRMTINEAVDAPRYHHQWLPDRLALEKGKFDISTIQALITMGYEVAEQDDWGDLHIVQYQPNGLLQAASDYRNGGKASGF